MFFFFGISLELPINQMSEYQNCTNFTNIKIFKISEGWNKKKYSLPMAFPPTPLSKQLFDFAEYKMCHWHILLGVLHYEHFVHNIDAQCYRMTDLQKTFFIALSFSLSLHLRNTFLIALSLSLHLQKTFFIALSCKSFQ